MLMSALRWCIEPRFLAVLLLLALPFRAWCASATHDIIVHVETDGASVTVDVDCPVDAPAAVVWEVLTDYEHMARFISNIEFSTVEQRSDNVLHVRQKGKTTKGPLTVRFEFLRQVELVPHREIRSHLLSGDLKESDFVTQVVEIASKVHILNKGRYTPNIWVPPVIGPAVIVGETQKQFGEIRAEILRRAAAARPPT